MKILACLLTSLCLPLFAVAQMPASVDGPPSLPGSRDRPITFSDNPVGHLYADIETSKGTIEVELDFQAAPLTTMHFVGLAEGTLPVWNRPLGQPFYDGLTFHRVVKNFVIQGGDPSSADPATPKDKLGEGGSDDPFPDEFSPALRHDMAGVLSMANDGPDTNESQFFITLAETNRLNYLHSVFGQVVRGMDVVNRIAEGDRIEHVTIRRSGPVAEAFRADEARFETLKQATLAKRHPAAPAGFEYLVDGTKTLPEFRVKNFNYKLANYERTTGHRVVVRLVPKFESESNGQTHGNFVKKMAAALGIPDTGDNVLACCFAAQHEWTTRLGEATYPALLGEAGPTDKLMASGVMHDRKAALVARADALAREDKLKESTDALIDTVIQTFDDHALQEQNVAK